MMLFEVAVGDKFKFDGKTFTRLPIDQWGLYAVREHLENGATRDWVMPPTEQVEAP